MNKSVLVLEENSVIHGLVGSALDIDGLTLHHEFNPENFVERAKSLMPDLILISNADQGSDYNVCRELKSGDSLGGVPVILLANSNETIDPDKLAEVHVDGVVRKPFEASDLQQQVSKHLDMVDLIGSAYEYKQSQSIDDKPDPLADLQVVDSDVLGLLQDGDEPRTPAIEALPDEAPADADAAAVDEGMLAETLRPEVAFEPVDMPADEPSVEEPQGGIPEDLTFPADEAMAPDAEPELTFSQMHGGELGEEEMEFGQEEAIEELGPADLLDEETGEEAPLPPAFDQSLEGEGVATVDSTPLEQIEVEIAEGEVDFDALGDDLQHDEVALFEAGMDDEAPGPSEGESEDIPLAVRRMMELKPIFPSQDEGSEPVGEDSDEDFVSLISSEGETGKFEDDLGTLDDIELDESPPPDISAAVAVPEEPVWMPLEGDDDDSMAVEAESTWTPLEDEGGDSMAVEESAPVTMGEEVAAVGSLDEDEEEFKEEYLGDEELDEDRILAAMQEAKAADQEEIEDDLDDIASETSEMDELVALSDVDASGEPMAGGAEQEGSELALDQDEEAMMMASLEEDAAFGGTIADSPAAEDTPEAMEVPFSADGEVPPIDPQLEQIETEAMGGLEVLEDSISEIEGMQAPEDPELDDIAAPELELSEPEWTAEGAEEPVGGASLDEDFDLSAESVEESTFMDDMSEPVDGSDDLGAGALDSGLELDATGDDAADELAQQDISGFMEDGPTGQGGGLEMEDAGLDDGSGGSAGDISDFEEELMGLKAEIEANPEGERLSDLLEKEGVQSAVDDLEFELPQEEHNMTRAMGVSELPDEDIDAFDADAGAGEALDEPMSGTSLSGEGPDATAEVPVLDLPGGMIDDAMKARLGEVLDEMITESVRKAVQDEIPKLMEQMEKENR